MKHADLPVHMRICTDGVPHLWYYDPETTIGFSWTGKTEHPVEVCVGGFGEPITNLIYGPPFSGAPLRLAQQLLEQHISRFELLCVSWLTAIAQGYEPRMVTEVRRG